MARSPCSSNRLEVELAESGRNDARERDARRYREEREAFRSREERPADDEPSEEDMRQAQLQRIRYFRRVANVGDWPGDDTAKLSWARPNLWVRGSCPVAHYYGGANPERWRAPVEKAVELLGGVV